MKGSLLDTSSSCCAAESGIASRQIFDLYCRYQSRRFVFVEQHANFGDYLIWKGAEKLAMLANIDFNRVPIEEFLDQSYAPDIVIYVHGGGGFTPWWRGSGSDVFLKAIATHHGIVLLGPQSFFDDQVFIRHTIANRLRDSVSERVFVFTRDLTSFDLLRKCLPGSVELGLDHDTALNLCAADVAASVPVRRFALYAIREDDEAVDEHNRNLLALSVDPVMVCRTFKQWVALHNRARRIVTNRLHSAVIGSILDIPTTLTPNNYHKNRSVWEYSLRQRHVEWRDEIPMGPAARTINAISPLRQLLDLQVSRRLIRLLVHGVRYRSL